MMQPSRSSRKTPSCKMAASAFILVGLIAMTWRSDYKIVSSADKQLNEVAASTTTIKPFISDKIHGKHTRNELSFPQNEHHKLNPTGMEDNVSPKAVTVLWDFRANKHKHKTTEALLHKEIQSLAKLERFLENFNITLAAISIFTKYGSGLLNFQAPRRSNFAKQDKLEQATKNLQPPCLLISSDTDMQRLLPTYQQKFAPQCHYLAVLSTQDGTPIVELVATNETSCNSNLQEALTKQHHPTMLSDGPRHSILHHLHLYQSVGQWTNRHLPSHRSAVITVFSPSTLTNTISKSYKFLFAEHDVNVTMFEYGDFPETHTYLKALYSSRITVVLDSQQSNAEVMQHNLPSTANIIHEAIAAGSVPLLLRLKDQTNLSKHSKAHRKLSKDDPCTFYPDSALCYIVIEDDGGRRASENPSPIRTVTTHEQLRRQLMEWIADPDKLDQLQLEIQDWYRQFMLDMVSQFEATLWSKSVGMAETSFEVSIRNVWSASPAVVDDGSDNEQNENKKLVESFLERSKRHYEEAADKEIRAATETMNVLFGNTTTVSSTSSKTQTANQQRPLCVERFYGRTNNRVWTLAKALHVAGAQNTIIGLTVEWSDWYLEHFDPRDDILLYYHPYGKCSKISRGMSLYHTKTPNPLPELVTLVPKTSTRDFVKAYLQKQRTSSSPLNDSNHFISVHRRDLEGNCLVRASCLDYHGKKCHEERSADSGCSTIVVKQMCDLIHDNVENPNKLPVVLFTDGQRAEYDRTFPNAFNESEVSSFFAQMWIMTLSKIHVGNPISTVDQVVYHWRRGRNMKPVECFEPF